MNSKRPRIPLEVSSWMQKDLTLRRATANARMLTNDTRPNIVLSRKFFSDLLTLSYSRYRTMAEHECEKKAFLRTQHRKSDLSMPGLRPCIDQLTTDLNRGITPHIQSSRRAEHSFVSPSTQSFLSRTGIQSDVVPYRRPQPVIRQVQTANIRRAQPTIALPPENSSTPVPPPLTTTTNLRPPTGRYMARERLNRLAQPKGFRRKSAPITQIPRIRSDNSPTAEEIIAELDQMAADHTPPEQEKVIVHDERFLHLMNVFTEVYSSNTSHTRQQIVAANTSLQDEEGFWKNEHPSVSHKKTELKHHRQSLADKLNRKIDVFLIETAA